MFAQDPCSISLLWVSPYSLVTTDVPLMSVLVNTTYYKFVPLVLNKTYIIEISAVNKAGEGNRTPLTASFTKGISRNYAIVLYLLLIVFRYK